jgi:hypothetical protein
MILKYELDSKKWIENEIMTLSPADYDHTYFIVAVLTNTVTNKSIDVIVPVDVYMRWDSNEVGLGFEIISIAAIAGLCPWDMRHTHIHAESEYTSVDDNLMKLVEETPSMPQAAKHFNILDQSDVVKLTLPGETETVANAVSDCMGDSLSSSIDDIKQRLDRVEKMVINPKINVKINP